MPQFNAAMSGVDLNFVEQTVARIGRKPEALIPILQALQEHHGYLPEEALERLEACHPDVVIMDVNMPGLGGAGTLPRLRALCPALPILLATGRIDQAALDLTRVHPLVTLLSKPFSMGELRQHL